MLSDDALNLIAHEVRTLPLAEVGRHVMPLIHHIAAIEDRECRNCRHWVSYNRSPEAAHNGECLHPQAVSHVRQEPTDEIALITPFDWSCKGWQEKQTPTPDALAQGTTS